MIEVKLGKYRDNKIGKVYEVEVYYSLGGINYFSGGTNRRGVYISIGPKEVSERTVSCVLLGNENESGMRMLLQELQRKNEKILCQWYEKVKPIVDDMIAIAKQSGVRASLEHCRNLLCVEQFKDKNELKVEV
jgi:hypothetical protein